jgi:regulator of protease activity HflC (stomatin/prohibitin superfamily)
VLLALAAVPILALAGFGYWWFVQRVEVGSGKLLILVHKVGAPLPDQAAGQSVLYPELLRQLGDNPAKPTYKGIVFEPKPEGRYFYDPFLWERIIIQAMEVRQEEIGILIRRYGKPLPPGKTVATAPDERGPLAEVLRPGRHNINPYAYELKRVRPVIIPAGYVGVRTLYSGSEPANSNQYVVSAGERGVQAEVLPPGLYYNNPYEARIDQIDVRSHTIDLHNDDAIRFPSGDSFDILVDCTVEYAVLQDRAPYVMVAIGDHDDVRDKLILPYTRSLCRIEGSKLLARDFIGGETRSAFQKKVFEGLREQCFTQGIEIRATLIRRIVPPTEIAGPISDRQVAGQQIKQYENEMKVAAQEARLVEQLETQKQNQAIGQANREVVSVTTEAQQRKAVALTEAHQRLEVARLNLQAAQETAAKLLSLGEAEAEVVRLTYEAEARPLRDAVAAFGDGETYAQFLFYQKLAPALKSVLASTDGPFAEIFRSFAETAARPPSSPQPARRDVVAGGRPAGSGDASLTADGRESPRDAGTPADRKGDQP